MELIMAYVRDYMVHKVVDVLRTSKTPRMTVIDAKALGDEIGHMQLHLSSEVGTYTRMAKIELVCSEESAKGIIEMIITAARTGYKGDGIIAVSHVEEAFSIRTGEEAIQA